MQQITVSNGSDFYRIRVEDLEDAIAHGCFGPGDRGLTIVFDGNDLYEIPLDDVARAL